MTQSNSKYIVLYDADCGICQHCVNLLKQLDSKNKTQAIPLLEGIKLNLHPQVNETNCLRQMHVLCPDNTLVKGWVATCTLAKLFSQTKILGYIGLLPVIKQLGQLAYILFANNRHKISQLLFGHSCKIN